MMTTQIEDLEEIRQDYMKYLEETRAINARREQERLALEAKIKADEQVCQ